ncbi:MAG: hypothetical protein ACXABI_14710 [Candidatus Hodarchaeales archaeon]
MKLTKKYYNVILKRERQNQTQIYLQYKNNSNVKNEWKKSLDIIAEGIRIARNIIGHGTHDITAIKNLIGTDVPIQFERLQTHLIVLMDTFRFLSSTI